MTKYPSLSDISKEFDLSKPIPLPVDPRIPPSYSRVVFIPTADGKPVEPCPLPISFAGPEPSNVGTHKKAMGALRIYERKLQELRNRQRAKYGLTYHNRPEWRNESNQLRENLISAMAKIYSVNT